MPHSDRPFGKISRTPPSLGAPPPVSTTSADGDGTKLNAAFIATVAALFVAVGSGTFFFLNGAALPSLNQGFAKKEEAPGYVSSVDKACGKGWRKDLPNIDQMHCYMTSSKRRLCDPQERAHLIATIERFEDDYGVWNARHFAAAMGSIVKANQNSFEIGMETAQLDRTMNDPNATDEEREKQADKVGEIMGDVLDAPNKILAEAKNTIPHYQLQIDLTDLLSMGLVAEDDFGWTKPDWVKKAFKEVKSVKSACAK